MKARDHLSDARLGESFMPDRISLLQPLQALFEGANLFLGFLIFGGVGNHNRHRETEES